MRAVVVYSILISLVIHPLGYAYSPEEVSAVRNLYGFAYSNKDPEVIRARLAKVNEAVKAKYDIDSKAFNNSLLGKLYRGSDAYMKSVLFFGGCRKNNIKHTDHYEKKKFVPAKNFNLGKYTRRVEGAILSENLSVITNSLVEPCSYIELPLDKKNDRNISGIVSFMNDESHFNQDVKSFQRKAGNLKTFHRMYMEQNLADSVYSYLNFHRTFKSKGRGDLSFEQVRDRFCSKRLCTDKQKKQLKDMRKKSIKRMNFERIKYINPTEAKKKINIGMRKLNGMLKKINAYRVRSKGNQRGNGIKRRNNKRKRFLKKKEMIKEYEREYYKLLSSPVGVLLQSDHLKDRLGKKRNDGDGIFKNALGDGTKDWLSNKFILHKTLSSTSLITGAVNEGERRIREKASGLYKDIRTFRHPIAEEGRIKHLKNMFQANPGALGKLLSKAGNFSVNICKVLESLAEEMNDKAFWDKVWMGAGFVSGGILMATGVGSGFGVALLASTAVVGGYAAHEFKYAKRAEEDLNRTKGAILTNTGDNLSHKDLEKLTEEVSDRLFNGKLALVLAPLDLLGVGAYLKTTKNLSKFNKSGIKEILKELSPELAKVGGKGSKNFKILEKHLGRLSEANRAQFSELLASPEKMKEFIKEQKTLKKLKTLDETSLRLSTADQVEVENLARKLAKENPDLDKDVIYNSLLADKKKLRISEELGFSNEQPKVFASMGAHSKPPLSIASLSRPVSINERGLLALENFNMRIFSRKEESVLKGIKYLQDNVFEALKHNPKSSLKKLENYILKNRNVKGRANSVSAAETLLADFIVQGYKTDTKIIKRLVSDSSRIKGSPEKIIEIKARLRDKLAKAEVLEDSSLLKKRALDDIVEYQSKGSKKGRDLIKLPTPNSTLELLKLKNNHINLSDLESFTRKLKVGEKISLDKYNFPIDQKVHFRLLDDSGIKVSSFVKEKGKNAFVAKLPDGRIKLLEEGVAKEGLRMSRVEPNPISLSRVKSLPSELDIEKSYQDVVFFKNMKKDAQRNAEAASLQGDRATALAWEKEVKRLDFEMHNSSKKSSVKIFKALDRQGIKSGYHPDTADILELDLQNTAIHKNGKVNKGLTLLKKAESAINRSGGYGDSRVAFTYSPVSTVGPEIGAFRVPLTRSNQSVPGRVHTIDRIELGKESLIGLVQGKSSYLIKHELRHSFHGARRRKGEFLSFADQGYISNGSSNLSLPSYLKPYHKFFTLEEITNYSLDSTSIMKNLTKKDVILTDDIIKKGLFEVNFSLLTASGFSQGAKELSLAQIKGLDNGISFLGRTQVKKNPHSLMKIDQAIDHNGFTVTLPSVDGAQLRVELPTKAEVELVTNSFKDPTNSSTQKLLEYLKNKQQQAYSVANLQNANSKIMKSNLDILKLNLAKASTSAEKKDLLKGFAEQVRTYASGVIDRNKNFAGQVDEVRKYFPDYKRVEDLVDNFKNSR